MVLKELVGFFHSYFEEMPVEKDPVLADQQPGIMSECFGLHCFVKSSCLRLF